MESHVLNLYHQARYRTIGHKVMRVKSDSLSSEGSTHNSPEYAQISLQSAPYTARAQSEDSTGEMNTTQSSQDTSSDEETDVRDDVEQDGVVQEHRIESEDEQDDSIVVQEVNVDDEDENVDVDDDEISEGRIGAVRTANGLRNYQLTDTNSLEDNTLVEGHDYDVITVYTVNPDLDLIEASSDDNSDQEDYAIREKDQTEYGEYLNAEDNPKYNRNVTESAQSTTSGIDLNLDTPVVSNVDEYFIRETGILETDGPVVNDVDEYFIKDKGKKNKRNESTTVPNIDDFFIKHNLPEEDATPLFNQSVDDFFIEKNIKKEQSEVVTKKEITEDEMANKDAVPENPDLSINESDLEVLPNIEELKRYFLEEMSYTKNIQRSCSLPQSPMQNICMDVDDAKTCLSFEDLNLDLSDLAFDNDKEKSGNANKSDDVPRTLTEEDVNSFLITKPSQNEPNSDKGDDNLDPEDMEIEATVESPKIDIVLPPTETPFRKLTSTPIPSCSVSRNILDFCIEKTSIQKQKPKKEITPIKKEIIPIKKEHPIKKKPPIKKEPPPKAKMIAIDPKLLTDTKPVIEPKHSADLDDFVDVESCNDTVIPVLAANNLNSLLEQFEATEKLNKSKKPRRVIPIPEEQKKLQNKNSLTNGTRLQDAGVQLNKNKMRQILMPSTINTAIRRSPSPVYSDHDYCSSKKRHSLPNLKGGQSLLKPEVLSSNSRILNSRHRTCKNKKIVYNLSSDDESETNARNKKLTSDSDFKNKAIKPAVKPLTQSNCRKKLSPTHSVSNDIVIKDKSNSSVINKSAFKASDTPCSQNSNGSIKLTIKNKSEVILNCDHKDSQKDKHNNIVEKCKTSVSDVSNIVSNVKQEKNTEKSIEKNIKEVDRNKNKCVNKVETVNSVSVKEETRPKEENFYTTLFSNKQDVKMPQATVKIEKNAFEEELNRAMEIKKEEPKKKKLNLQEYKLRRGASSNNSSATVSPEAIFPDMPHPLLILDKTAKPLTPTPSNGIAISSKYRTNEAPTKIFDPIREASRKILMNTKKQKAEALRKRDEDIVMSKIPKVENLELQPLISEAEMMKIVGMAQPEQVPLVNEKPQLPADYVEIILVSVGTNTDEAIIEKLEADIRRIENSKRKSTTPPIDPKLHINFKIKKSDHVLKQNVFDKDKRDKRSPMDDKKHSETKIDKERFKDITATLKSVGKQVDSKMSSNSLFASIQDVVMKKAPDKEQEAKHKLKSPIEKREVFTFGRPTIVREYDLKADHGEDKVILHLGKHRTKPTSTSTLVQTDPIPGCPILSKAKTIAKEKSSVNRRRNDSDMSMSSEDSPVKKRTAKTDEKNDKVTKKSEIRPEKRSLSKEKRSRSRDRYEKYRRRSRSRSRSRRRRRSHSRSRSRSKSRGRYHRRSYRRSDRSVTPYKRKRRSRSRSYQKKRSPSVRRDHRSNRSKSRHLTRSKSPMPKKTKPSPPVVVERKPDISLTPPLRKSTVSESSDSSTSSSSSSSTSSSSNSSNSSGGSRKSIRSSSPYQRDEYRKKYRSFSSEDRDNNTPVEERRIVFVGKLEKDITKSALRGLFSKFGPVIEVRLHTKEDGTRYGFVTYQRARDAWTAVDQAATFPQYDVGFGGRRAFCRQSYADLDGLEAKYTESAFHGAAALPTRRTEDLSFEQMLQEMKKKLSQRKTDKKHDHP